MSETNLLTRIRTTLALFAIAGALAACGGGSSSGAQDPGTGTVALLLTDMPTDDLKEIRFDVVEAILIGGAGQQTLFSSTTDPVGIDLLNLENFSQPVAFEDVPADVYTKLRLRIDNLVLVDMDDVAHTPPLPANGKIDLLHPQGFEVLPGRTLVVELDMDANKSIHVVQTGNGGYRMRPVVFVEFTNTGAPDKLARIEGVIDEIVDGAAGSFVVCSSDDADTCIDVALTTDGCVFDVEGVPTEPTALEAGNEVVVIGRYSRMGGDIMLDAIVVEQGPANQFQGTVNSVPEAGTFLMIDRAGNEFTVELQDGCTQVLGPEGAIIGASGLQVGLGIEVEGVAFAAETEGDPGLLRAALVIVDGNDAAEQISGTIAVPIDEPAFVLATAGGDVTVVLDEGATISLISPDSEISVGSFADVQEGLAADAFGELDTVDGTFHASSVVIETGE